MGRNLLKDLNCDELESMRASGMTNMDIANVLGVSISTVYRCIGAQNYHSARRQKRQMEPPSMEVPKTKHEEEPDASLVVENRTIGLAGLYAGYKVNIKDKNVVVFVEDNVDALVVPFDQIENFARELAAISRHISGLHIGNEMW